MGRAKLSLLRAGRNLLSLYGDDWLSHRVFSLSGLETRTENLTPASYCCSQCLQTDPGEGLVAGSRLRCLCKKARCLLLVGISFWFSLEPLKHAAPWTGWYFGNGGPQYFQVWWWILFWEKSPMTMYTKRSYYFRKYTGPLKRITDPGMVSNRIQWHVRLIRSANTKLQDKWCGKHKASALTPKIKTGIMSLDSNWHANPNHLLISNHRDLWQSFGIKRLEFSWTIHEWIMKKSFNVSKI